MKHRKKTLLTQIIVLTTMLVLFIAGTTMAASDYREKAYVNVVRDRLNLREQPTTKSKVIGKLNAGDLVTLVHGNIETDSWVEVATQDGEKGYVSTKYLKMPRMNQGDYEVVSVAVITAESSSENRNFNMAKACESLNGMIMFSGDQFDWYGEYGVGEASLERGYKKATVISGGKYVTGEGGGVCQVSTALYNCIYKLGIEPDEINHHSKDVSYVPNGMDATVAYSDNKDYMKNFVFTNTLDYTLIFEAYADGPQVVVVAYKER